ncbi:hypothetical protein sscle_05g041150 [Sclerotinia sclerotiorum 1980 UF-70]|uniref:Uncharacterized protein n=1 Tax=Sclerotinia sclerotiorum (strain ATCC 18683 / 1980 / Ss-1) TaxID=665079 RepID=A0A1D9Q319_SCLS1|nr:hypothetical protein sscle_05g041150 [Sclerotinia sclerotiorum 1980 UF-70]
MGMRSGITTLCRNTEACVLKRAYYGAETWWPGRTQPGRVHPTKVEGHINYLSKITLECARAILPAWRTTNTATLYRESGLRPPEIELDDLARAAAICKGSFILGKSKEVYNAETVAALEGLRAATTSIEARTAIDIWICLDNIEVAARLLSNSTGSSQETFTTFRQLASSWPNGTIRIRWIPGYKDVAGNEAANKAVKTDAALLQPEGAYSYAGLRRETKGLRQKAINKLWSTVIPQSYKELEILTSPKSPKELALPRSFLGRLLAIRSGHGDFAAYHERFHYQDAHLICRCGARKSPLHFFFCHIAKRKHPQPKGKPAGLIPFLYGTYKGAETLEKWTKSNGFFTNICPQHYPLPSPMGPIPDYETPRNNDNPAD